MHQIDRQPRHLEQVHRDTARHLRAEVLLHVGGIDCTQGTARPIRRIPFVIASRQLIDAESIDDGPFRRRLVEKLKSDGIEIARRTVAKYREAMRIPSSVQRRREKRLTERVARIA